MPFIVVKRTLREHRHKAGLGCDGWMEGLAWNRWQDGTTSQREVLNRTVSLSREFVDPGASAINDRAVHRSDQLRMCECRIALVVSPAVFRRGMA
jgi:hypothetical protein